MLCVVYFVIILPLLNMGGATQAQTPATPTPLPRAANPTATLDCGFPLHGYWNQDFYTDNPTLNKPHTWTLTEDCILPKIADDSAWLHYANNGSDLADATFIIDGAGYTVYGPDDDTTFIFIDNDSKVVLRNITIKDAVYDHDCFQYDNGWWWCSSLINVDKRSELDARDVTISTNSGGALIQIYGGSKAKFKNLTVTDNTFNSTYLAYAGIVSARGANTEVTIDGAVICKNQARHLVSAASNATATLKGGWQVYGKGANTWIDALKNKDPDDDVKRNTGFSYKAAGGAITQTGSRFFCPGFSAAMLADDAGKNDDHGKRGRGSRRVEVFTCQKLVDANPDILVFATYGLRSGVACQQVAGAGIGIQSVLDLGVIDAVDVWAYVSQGVEVCFQHFGRMLFLDADAAPRAPQWIAHTYADGWTCSHISGHGTLVLIAPPAGEAELARNTASLGSCELTASDMLSLRAGPGVGYERIEVIPYQSRLAASAKTDGWFKVEYSGKAGWVSGAFVLSAGRCD